MAPQTGRDWAVFRWKPAALALLAILECRPPFSVEQAARHSDYVRLEEAAGIRVLLRYSTTDNFLGEDLYGDRVPALLHREAAARLQLGAAFLGAEAPGHSLLVWDALRPRSVQRRMWGRVAGTPAEGYVANPERGSVHNYGLAVDLTVVDARGRTLDMGTDYDDFRALAEPAREAEFLRSGRLSRAQRENRLLLRRAMLRAGFEPFSKEWWHFDAFPGWWVREHYSIVE